MKSLRPLIWLLAQLCWLAKAEEESILAGASVVDEGIFDASETPQPGALIGENFKSLIMTDGSSAEVAIKIALKESATIHSIFLINHTAD